MGVDLFLLPIKTDVERIKLCFSHTILECDRDLKLFEKIKKLPAFDVPFYFCSYLSKEDGLGLRVDNHYGYTTKDSYGIKLKCVYAKDLYRLIQEEILDRFLKEGNKAIMMYLSILSPDSKIVLYWD